MSAEQARVLVVDDEALNRMLITEYLRGSGYDLVTAEDGLDAWEKLISDPKEYDVVLLDLMMPRMDGMEVLKRIKAHPTLQILPVVLQTALASPEDIHKGIRAGAYYYLTKPFEREMLCSVIATAVQDRRRYYEMREQIDRTSRMFGLMSRAEFHYRTLDEGRELARVLAHACPEPRKVVVGLAELLVNAVEHGNLGIGYQEKGRLLETGQLDVEVRRRLLDSRYQGREVEVHYERNDREVSIRIVDQGEGFDWKRYAQVDPSRVFDAHGRGIAVAQIMSFDRVEFQGKGNEVLGVIKLDG